MAHWHAEPSARWSFRKWRLEHVSKVWGQLFGYLRDEIGGQSRGEKRSHFFHALQDRARQVTGLTLVVCSAAHVEAERQRMCALWRKLGDQLLYQALWQDITQHFQRCDESVLRIVLVGEWTAGCQTRQQSEHACAAVHHTLRCWRLALSVRVRPRLHICALVVIAPPTNMKTSSAGDPSPRHTFSVLD